jgi:hypothetical protein
MQKLVGTGVELLALPIQPGKLDKTLAVMRRHYDNPGADRSLVVENLFGCNAVDGLVKAFSKVLGMISTRITLDHL